MGDCTQSATSWRACTAQFPGRTDQIRHARALITGFLSDCPSAADAVLLVSELATNAIQHTASGHPGGTFTLRAEITTTGFRAEVEDQGSTWHGDLTTAQCPHGLYLLHQLTDTCGSRPGEHGWVLWFELACPAREPGDQSSDPRPALVLPHRSPPPMSVATQPSHG